VNQFDREMNLQPAPYMNFKFCLAQAESLPSPTDFARNFTDADFFRSPLFVLPLFITIIALCVLGMSTYLIRNNHSANEVLKAFGVIMIITAAVFLVAGGYKSEADISPIIGLLGTVAGYLLGRYEQKSGEQAQVKSEPKGAKDPSP
jgi:multisubunit Na+/H+ antiporter MnhF subunit